MRLTVSNVNKISSKQKAPCRKNGRGIIYRKKVEENFKKHLTRPKISAAKPLVRVIFQEVPPMKHSPKEVRNALISLIREVGKNAPLFARDPSRDFTRKRKLDIETLLHVLLTMENKTLSCELLRYFGVRADVVSAPAFIQQRAKLLPEALEYILRKFSAMFRGSQLYRGYRLLAVDGSDVQIPTDPADAETFFPGSGNQKPFNITKIAAIYDLLNHTYVDALVKGKAMANENKLLIEMVFVFLCSIRILPQSLFRILSHTS